MYYVKFDDLKVATIYVRLVTNHSHILHLGSQIQMQGPSEKTYELTEPAFAFTTSVPASWILSVSFTLSACRIIIQKFSFILHSSF